MPGIAPPRLAKDFSTPGSLQSNKLNPELGKIFWTSLWCTAEDSSKILCYVVEADFLK